MLQLTHLPKKQPLIPVEACVVEKDFIEDVDLLVRYSKINLEPPKF